MADSARPAFRPMRIRASLGALPSGAPLLLDSQSINNKENPSTSRDSAPPAPLGEAVTAPSTTQNRKKRAQSLGGDALGGATKRSRTVEALRRDSTFAFELSPGKLERRRAMPRRSILKQTPAKFEEVNHTISFPAGASSISARLAAWEETHAQTTDLSALSAFSTAPGSSSGPAPLPPQADAQTHAQRRRSSLKPRTSVASGTYDDSDLSGSDMDEEDDDPNGSLDMDVTRFENATALYDLHGGRKSVSHSRRVSFAPSAAIRTFTPDKPTAEAQAYEAARLQAEAEAAEAASAAGETSLTRSWSGDEQDDDAAGDDDTDAFEQEASMEIAGDEVTLAFRGHFAGTQIPVSALQEDDDQEEEEEEDGASTVSASAPTSSSFPLFGAAPASAPAAAGGAKRGGPRPSEVARREDEDDEAVMRELGFTRGGRPRKSRVASAIVDEDEDEDESEVEEMEDATGAMEMTTAMGGIIGTASQTGDDDEEDDDEVDSDAEVSMQLTSGNRTVDMTFATDADVGIVEDNVDEQDDDATTAMAEATTYGSILPPPSPAAQGPTVVAAASRTSLGPSLTAPPNPFERAGSAPPFQQPPPKSPAERAAAYLSPVRDSSSSTTRPGLSRALSVPLEAAGGGARTPTRSPFLGRGRYSTSPAPPGARSSPFRSPRRVPLDSPQAGSTNLPPAMLGPKSPAHARRSVSPVKGAPPSSLAKKASAAAATEQDKVDDQPGITPRSRSRSRSRSLSPVKQAQQQPPATPGRAVFQPRALAPPQSAGRSPGGSLSLRALLMTGAPKDEADAAAPADKRLAELKNGGQGEELNLTGSSFDASFSHENDAPALPGSLDAFFGLTGTSFVNDVVALVDVEKSAANRRKSMAAPSGSAADAREPAGPPTFADLTVAGACKSLLHKLYTEESRRLAESLDEVQQIYRQQEEAIREGFVPRVFHDWSSASEETKNVMKTQFGQIKLHYLLQTQLEWKTVRSHNYGEIIGVMEQNLRGLQEDRATIAEVEVSSVVPDLEARHAALRAELEAERQLDAQLSAMAPEDVEYLQGLLADSEEQEEQLNGNAAKGIAGQRPELDRIKQHLLSYQETFDKYSTEERRLADEIAALEELRRDKRSKADLVRLRADFDALQHLQGWTVVRFDTREVHMRCGDDFVARLALREGSLEVVGAAMELAQQSQKRAGSLGGQVTAALLHFVAEDVRERLAAGSVDARALLRYIGARATMLRHVRHEVALTSLRYPTTLSLSPSSGSPTLDIDVFCASSRVGFVVSVPLSGDMLEGHEPERWAVEGASATVLARFGKGRGAAAGGAAAGVNALALAQTVNDRLSAGYGRSALLDAVVAAEEEADQL
ncbi:Proteophosphoglycan ppg4 [Rhodotorula diobovata]|uniref:Proteophosphoglycan ppg4 n=1 Tax=Rhodotorula diobovata TaxID=5288 RepID=A0A5C5FVG0_9BASI|nr:Proteophosphoglycan ppg4 [Rhodotorula diobovata]